MDNTMLIEVTNEKAVKLLKETVSPERKKLSDKYRGSITKEQGANLNEHINQMRGEWSSAL